MRKDVLINVRVEQGLKDDFQSVCEAEGFTMSDVIEATMTDIAQRAYVPINIKSKIYRHKKSLVSIPFIKKCVEEALAKTNNTKIRSVSLFGSYAKGSATPKSDIDLLIAYDDGFSLFNLADLQLELERLLQKKVDLVTKTDDASFMSYIQKERIQLYERII